MCDPVADFYSKPQVGSGIAIFQGNRRQTGGGIFASIQRFAVPILRRIGQRLLSVAPSVGAKAMEVVKDTISDVRSGKRLGDSLKSNISNKIQKTLNDYTTDQSGSGKRRRWRRKNGINRKRKKKSAVKKGGITKRRKKKKWRRRTSTKKKKLFRDIFSQ